MGSGMCYEQSAESRSAVCTQFRVQESATYGVQGFLFRTFKRINLNHRSDLKIKVSATHRLSQVE